MREIFDACRSVSAPFHSIFAQAEELVTLQLAVHALCLDVLYLVSCCVAAVLHSS